MTPDRIALKAAVTKLAKATGPSRDLDIEIVTALLPIDQFFRARTNITASLDAVLDLFRILYPEGRMVLSVDAGKTTVRISLNGGVIVDGVKHRTAALAGSLALARGVLARPPAGELGPLLGAEAVG